MDKKKVWLLLGAVALSLIIITVVLCTGSKQEDAADLPLIGLCLRQYEQDPELGDRLQQRLEQSGYRAAIADALNDQVKQNHQITDFVEEGAVLVVVEPVITGTAPEIITSLKSPNVPVVFVNYLPEEDVLQMWDRFSSIYLLEETLGSRQADVILDAKDRGDKNKDGQVSCLVIAGPEDDRFAVNQAQACVRRLEEKGQTVTVLDILYSNETKENCYDLCNKALSQYGKDIEVIFCGNGEATQGALEAMKDGGWKADRDFYLIGADADGERNQNYTAILSADTEAFMESAYDAITSLLSNKPVEQIYYVNHKVMTPEE